MSLFVVDDILHSSLLHLRNFKYLYHSMSWLHWADFFIEIFSIYVECWILLYKPIYTLNEVYFIYSAIVEGKDIPVMEN